MHAKKKMITLNAGTEDVLDMELTGLTFNELSELAGFSDKNDTKGAMNYLLFTGLRKALPIDGDDMVSDDEVKELINELDSKVATAILKQVQELSGLGEEKKQEGE